MRFLYYRFSPNSFSTFSLFVYLSSSEYLRFLSLPGPRGPLSDPFLRRQVRTPPLPPFPATSSSTVYRFVWPFLPFFQPRDSEAVSFFPLCLSVFPIFTLFSGVGLHQPTSIEFSQPDLAVVRHMLFLQPSGFWACVSVASHSNCLHTLRISIVFLEFLSLLENCKCGPLSPAFLPVLEYFAVTRPAFTIPAT